MAARFRVVILEQEDARTFRYMLWADVPATRQVFYVTTANSAWKDAIEADNDALHAGQVVERVDKLVVVAGTTLAQARVLLEAVWQAYQDKITADNPWQRYGSTWDGSTWVAGGVA